MKTAISIPDPVFEAADQLAARIGMSRSELYATAVAEFMDRHLSSDSSQWRFWHVEQQFWKGKN